MVEAVSQLYRTGLTIRLILIGGRTGIGPPHLLLDWFILLLDLMLPSLEFVLFFLNSSDRLLVAIEVVLLIEEGRHPFFFFEQTVLIRSFPCSIIKRVRQGERYGK